MHIDTKYISKRMVMTEIFTGSISITTTTTKKSAERCSLAEECCYFKKKFDVLDLNDWTMEVLEMICYCIQI